ncbi:MAG: MBL fold metallo-hydrolase [Lysobacterales bacterium]
MNRPLKSAAVVFTALFVLSAGAQDFSKVEISTIKVTDGVFMLQGAGGNIGLSVGDDGAFIVDDQYAPLAEKIRAAIAQITLQPVSFVVNTHWHGDHAGGNEAFGSSGSVIVAHDNVHKRMSAEHVSTMFNRTIPASPPAALPRITFTERVTLQMNGGVHAIHAPNAHTDGDALIYFAKANVLHMGDTFFNGMYPFIDLDSGGSIGGLIDAVNKGLMLANADTHIIPGHGALSTRQDMQAYRDMLVALRDRVAELKSSGKTLQEVIDVKPGAQWDATWGTTFIKPAQIVTFIYNSL